MAEALAIVKVGKTEWLLRKSTPSVRSFRNVGMSAAVTEPRRRPSATKIMTLRFGACAESRSVQGTNRMASAQAHAFTADKDRIITIVCQEAMNGGRRYLEGEELRRVH